MAKVPIQADNSVHPRGTGNQRVYIGDGAYAEIDPLGGIILTTENGSGQPSNVIYLEPDVWDSLKEFVKAVR